MDPADTAVGFLPFKLVGFIFVLLWYVLLQLPIWESRRFKHDEGSKEINNRVVFAIPAGTTSVFLL